MSGSEGLRALRFLSRSSGLLTGSENVTRRCLARSMATEAQIHAYSSAKAASPAPWDQPVSVMTYKFPSMEPARLVEYSQKQLLMPLRRDLLHRAVIYEGDNTRQGTASTKWRDDVHGSHRKILPQKGSGKARAGDKQSPIRKGGGVAHGPHPRDFSTDLPAKVYDQAWRTALSYRFSRGELIVIDNKMYCPESTTPFYLQNFMVGNGWTTKSGRSTFITEKIDETLFDYMSKLDRIAAIRDWENVDVKDLLSTGRLIIERRALDQILKHHSRDLTQKPAKATYIN